MSYTNNNKLRRSVKMAMAAMTLAASSSVALAEENQTQSTNSDTQLSNNSASNTTKASARSKSRKESEAEKIIVVGTRAALDQARNVKLNSDQLVDAISAEDIGQFPDENVAESLQRISGIQINRDDANNGSEVAIRGMGETQTLINGRTYFTGFSRQVNFQDVPSEAMRAVKVYKSPSADQIEGGIGGTINMQRLNSANFKNLKAILSAKTSYGDLIEKHSPKISGMVGNRTELDGNVLGMLFAFNHQRQHAGFHRTRTYDFTIPLDSIEGAPEGAVASRGANIVYGENEIERSNLIVGFDFEPNDKTRIYLDGGYTSFDQDQRRDAVSVRGDNKGRHIESATFENPDLDVTTISHSRGQWDTDNQINLRKTENFDLGVGFEYAGDGYSSSGDIFYVNSDSELNYRTMRLRDTVNDDGFSVDYNDSTDRPPSLTTNAELTNPDIWQFRQYIDRYRDQDSSEIAARYDVDIDVDWGSIYSLEVGARWVSREATSALREINTQPRTAVNIDDLPGLYILSPDDHYEKGSNFSWPNQFLMPDTDFLLANNQAIRDFYGISSEFRAQPGEVFEFDEDVTAAYVKTNFEWDYGDIPIMGNAGFRVVHTKQKSVGAVGTVGNASNFTPLVVENSETEVLPSFNIRANLTDELIFRIAGSRTLGRPAFRFMNPSIQLSGNGETANAGNPNLETFKANNFDLSLEWYFDKSNLLAASVFYKELEGFLVKRTNTQIIFDQEVDVTTRENGEDGKLRGIEISYQQFFDFLPGLWSNLGVQVNGTFISSDVASPVEGLELALENLSESSYNLVGIYDDGKFSARLSYTWREDFYDELRFDEIPLYRVGGEQLDLSMNYKATDNLKFNLTAVNLLRDERHTYYQDITRPRDFGIADRRLVAGVRYKF